MSYHPLLQEQEQQKTYKKIIMSKILEREKKSEYQKKWYADKKSEISSRRKLSYESKGNDRKIKKLSLQAFKIGQEIELLGELRNKKNMEICSLAAIEHDKGNPDYADFFSKTRA